MANVAVDRRPLVRDSAWMRDLLVGLFELETQQAYLDVLVRRTRIDDPTCQVCMGGGYLGHFSGGVWDGQKCYRCGGAGIIKCACGGPAVAQVGTTFLCSGCLS